MDFQHFFFGSSLVCFAYVVLHICLCSDLTNLKRSVSQTKTNKYDAAADTQSSERLPMYVQGPNSHKDNNRAVKPSNIISSIISDDMMNYTKLNSSQSVQVIIVTRWRSGSSFLGEVFNNDPDFIYIFEPLIGRKTSKDLFNHQHETILHDLVKCDFTNKEYNWWDGQVPTNCERSQAFGRTMLCGPFRKYLKTTYAKSSRIIQELCRNRRHVAIKTVRVPDIGLLKNIVSDSGLNVKIIHLVHDPRAWYFSRKATKGVKDMEYGECSRELPNNLKFWQNPPSWLKGHHLLLRYEDSADDPLLITRKIYEFLGVKVPETVKLWLEYNTNWNQKGEFSRSKVLRETAHAWRLKMDYTMMLKVQKRCAKALKMTGYKMISSEKDLRNRKVSTRHKFNYPLLPHVVSIST